MEYRGTNNEKALPEGWAARPSVLRSAAAGLLCLLGACGSPTEPNTTPSPSTANPPATPTQVGQVVGGAPAPTGSVPVAGSGSYTQPNTPVVTAGTGAAPVTTPPAGVAGSEILPCGVKQSLATNCQTCHAASPIGGAPMPMMTYADLHKPAVTKPTMKVWELSKARIHDTARPMPPIGTMPAADKNALDTWFAGGALAGTAADANCEITGKPDTVGPGGHESDRPAKGKLVPLANEKCYEFVVHGGQTSGDTTKFPIKDGEFYEQFYYKVPWEAGSVATAYATIGDNEAVLHHWLLFSTNELQAEGTHFESPLPTLIGTDPMLLAGWAVGAPNLIAPKDVGFELPEPGQRTINVQWHFYNSTGTPQSDASSVQICTVPKATVKNIGNITWLGTEDLYGNIWFGGQGMPSHQVSKFTTTCTPSRAGATNTPIHIMGFEPHMHRIGKRMKTSIKKADGTLMQIFDEPFNFGNETHYFVSQDLMPGESLVTDCIFNNDNNFRVAFGESSDTEMCYQFTFAYPAHALRNGAASLLGVPDTCWGPTTKSQIASVME